MPSERSLIGFGLDAQYAPEYPFGMEKLCQLYNDSLSHLSIVSLQSEQQAAWFRKECAQGLPIIHHLSNVAPGDYDGPHLARLGQLDKITKTLGALWACEDVGIWSIGPYGIPYFAPPIFEDEMAELIVGGIRRMQELSSVIFLAETPSCSFIAGRMGLGDFFHKLVDRTGCKVVLDVGHVYSYALYFGQDPVAVLESLPLDAVLEIHVAGAKISKLHSYRYIDTHSDPILENVESLLLRAVEKCRHLRCITYELGVKLSSELIESEVARLESALRSVNWRPSLVM